jgi:hypothetical protein
LPLFYINNFAGKRLESIPFSAYGGVLGEKSCSKVLIQKAIELRNKLNCKHILIKQPPNSEAYKNIFEKLDLRMKQRRLSQYALLKDPKEMWGEIRSSNRRAISKGRRNEVIIKIITNEDELKDAYQIDLNICKRFGVLPFSFKDFKEVWFRLKPSGLYEIFIAKWHGEVVAYTSFLNFNNWVIGYRGISNKLGRKLGAHPLLLWVAIEWSYKQGYKIFDLGPTPTDSNGEILDNFKGIYDFKASFNTLNGPYSFYCYPGSVKIVDRLIGSNVLNKFGHTVIRRTPKVVFKRFGTYLIKKFF